MSNRRSGEGEEKGQARPAGGGRAGGGRAGDGRAGDGRADDRGRGQVADAWAPLSSGTGDERDGSAPLSTEVSTTQQGAAFERRVGHLFGLLGYRVQYDLLIGGRQVDLFLEDSSGPLSRQYVVECKDEARPVSTLDYDSFAGRVRLAQREHGAKVRGILVSSVGFVKQARAQSRLDDIELLTISELETNLIDFRAYVDGLETELTHDPALSWFVEPRCRRETLTLAEPFLDLFEEWLRHPTRNQLTLLGDFGTGKTTLLKHIAWKLARRYRETAVREGARALVPIYIDLRDYTHAISLKQIVLDFLDHHGVRAASYAAFEHVLAEGQVLLLLDGFDEMASRGNYKVTLRNFRELHKNVLGRAKIVLSCRTHYFTTEREVHRFHGQHDRAMLSRSYTDLYRDIAARANFVLVHLLEFGPEQIELYLERRCGRRWPRVLEFIESTYNLAELSKRPVLLDMIVTSESRLDPGSRTISPGLLYQVYTDIWLTTNDWSTVIDLEAKGELLEQLARRLVGDSEDGIPYRELPEMIRLWSPGLDTPSAIEIDRDLRTASFLVRDDDGRYRFSHQSFLEFFYARGLLSDAAGRQPAAWSKHSFGTEVYRFLRDLLPESEEATQCLLDWLHDDSSSPRLRINASKCLGGLSTPEVVEGLLRSLRHDPDEEVRATVVTALARQTHPAIVGHLVRAVRTSRNRFVRSNGLTALVRQGTPKAREFLLAVLRGDEPEVRLDHNLLLRPYRAVLDDGDPELVDACVARAPRRPAQSRQGTTSLALQTLDLVARYPSESGLAYAETLLGDTRSPRIASRAFSALPVARRRRWLGPVLERIRELGRRRAHHDLLVEMVRSLHDAAADGDGPSLDDAEEIFPVMNELLCHSGDADTLEAAFQVVVATTPERVASSVERWTGSGRPHYFKLLVIGHLARVRPEQVFDELVALLVSRQRVATKIGLLRILEECYPREFTAVVENLWAGERTPRVKQEAAERLLRLDRAVARRLLLEALDDPRSGTRAVACSILGSETDAEVTGALVSVLGRDASKGVRMQALRSLCAPGRRIAHQQILDATVDEPEDEVLRLRDDLLGRLGRLARAAEAP